MKIITNLRDISDHIQSKAQQYSPQFEQSKKYFKLYTRALSREGLPFKDLLDFYKASKHLSQIKDYASKMKNPKTKLSSVVSVEKIQKFQDKADQLGKLCDRPLIESVSFFKIDEATFINNIEEIEKIIGILEENIGIFEDLAKSAGVTLVYIKQHLNQLRDVLKNPRTLKLTDIASALAIDYEVPLKYAHSVIDVIKTFKSINLKDCFSKLELPTEHVFNMFAVADKIVKDKITFKLLSDFVQEFYLLSLEYSKTGIQTANRVIKLFPKPTYKLILNDFSQFRNVVDTFQKLVQDLTYNDHINQAIKTRTKNGFFDKYIKFLKKTDQNIEKFKTEGLPITASLASALHTDSETVSEFSNRFQQFVSGDATFLQALDWFLPFSSTYLNNYNDVRNIISDENTKINTLFNKALDLSHNKKFRKNAESINKMAQEFLGFVSDKVPFLDFINSSPSKYNKFSNEFRDTLHSSLWDFFTSNDPEGQEIYDQLLDILENASKHYYEPIPQLINVSRYNNASKKFDKFVNEFQSLEDLIKDSYGFSKKYYDQVNKYLNKANKKVASFNSSIADVFSYANLDKTRFDSMINEMKAKAQDPNNTKLVDLVASVPKDIWNVRATLENISNIDISTTFNDIIDMFTADNTTQHKNVNDVVQSVKQATNFSKIIKNRLDTDNLTIKNILSDVGVTIPETLATKVNTVLDSVNASTLNTSIQDVANRANISTGAAVNVANVLSNCIGSNSLNINVGVRSAEQSTEKQVSSQTPVYQSGNISSSNKTLKIVLISVAGAIGVIGIIFVIVFVAKKKCNSDDEALI